MRTRHLNFTRSALPTVLTIAALAAWPASLPAQPTGTGVTRPAMTQAERAAAERKEAAERKQAAEHDQKNAAAQNADDKGGEFSVQPESMTFGKTPLYFKRSDSFKIRNHGQSTLHNLKVDLGGYNEKVFTLENGCRDTLAPGQECEVKVGFEPTSDGDKSVELRVTAGNGAVRTRNVTGSGVMAKYTATPKSLAFGKVARNSNGKEQVVTIKNVGTVNLPITSTSLGGPNEKQFYQSNDCPRELPVGQTCKSTVQFHPTFEGHHTATLTVWAKGGAPETKVELSGTGT